MSTNAARELRRLLATGDIVCMPGVHDALGALVCQQAGFQALFCGGFGTSAALLGLPDINFLGLEEITRSVRHLTARVSLPVLADADTGHGDLHNVMHCVRAFEEAGAAGIILEDQEFPKRCGHFGGKRVISAEEMELKWAAAREARRNPDFLFVARTDARETHDLDEAIDRVNRYCAAGADVAFIEAPLSEGELRELCKRVPYPKLVNMLAFGKTPILSAAALQELGFAMMVAPIDSVLLYGKAMQEMASALLRDGHTQTLAERMLGFEDIKQVLGLSEYLTLRERLQKSSPHPDASRNKARQSAAGGQGNGKGNGQGAN